jgi:hypothetical protein
MTIRYFVNTASGAYLGSFDGPNGGYWDGKVWGPPPAGVTQVPTAPSSADSIYTNSAWVPGPSAVAASAQAQLASALGAGLAITSTAKPAELDATYALDAVSQQQISDIAVPLFAGAGFPGGGQTFAYPDATGATHNFAVADFQNFYQAVRTYLLALNTAAATVAQGGPANWPAAASKIA